MTGYADARPPEVSVDSEVIATGDAQVNQQVATQFVSSVLHNAKIYNTVPGDPPERRKQVARAHLYGGNPRRAEDILRGLLTDGYSTPELVYLYVLSVLSDRSFTEITMGLSDEIHNAMSMAAALPTDDWSRALDVVDMLLRYAHAGFGDGTVAEEFKAAQDAFSTLSAERQDEIDRHLDLILSGAVQEQLASRRKHQVAVERMSGNRAHRAWKFFEADPREPLKWPTPPVRSAAPDWWAAILGCGLAACALLDILDGSITIDAILGLALITAGGYVLLRYTTIRQAHLDHAESTQANFQSQPDRQDGKFDKLVNQCFREGDPGGLWEKTADYRDYLKRRLQAQYGADDRYVGELKWLIVWHVDRAGSPYGHAPEPPEVRRALCLRIGGVLLGVAGVAFLLAAGHVMALLLAACVLWGMRGIARIRGIARARTLLDRDADALLAEEQAEYWRWKDVLADRPEDGEMARWLTLDMAYLKDDALRRAHLHERDLVTHVVLTERAPFARKGRVTDGPPRYEKYEVYLILLTQYGMRAAQTRLDLTTGNIHNEQCQMFPYDAVASASVAEKSLRTFLADGSPSVGRFNGRVFRLTLLNGTDIAEVKEDSRTVSDARVGGNDQDPSSEYTAGFSSALRILEAVATEGRDWIVRDRERKQRWARNWRT